VLFCVAGGSRPRILIRRTNRQSLTDFDRFVSITQKKQPGPFPISHLDLADFSLNALLTKKLYNSCPYVD